MALLGIAEIVPVLIDNTTDDDDTVDPVQPAEPVTPARAYR